MEAEMEMLSARHATSRKALRLRSPFQLSCCCYYLLGASHQRNHGASGES